MTQAKREHTQYRKDFAGCSRTFENGRRNDIGSWKRSRKALTYVLCGSWGTMDMQACKHRWCKRNLTTRMPTNTEAHVSFLFISRVHPYLQQFCEHACEYRKHTKRTFPRPFQLSACEKSCVHRWRRLRTDRVFRPVSTLFFSSESTACRLWETRKFLSFRL